MKKRIQLCIALFLALLLSGCGAPKNEYVPGDTISTYWFDFVVEEVERSHTYAGYQAQEGTELVICSLELKNTFGEDLPMGWMDFVLTWIGGEESGVYPLTTISQEQLPEVYHLEPDGQIGGHLVFEIPENAAGIHLVFQERYAAEDDEGDYTEGLSYRVALG